MLHVLATRADVVTLAPVVAALDRSGAFLQSVLLMEDESAAVVATDLQSLGMPEPEHVVATGSASDGVRMAAALAGAEALLGRLRPAAVVVSGAASSSFACALAATRMNVPVARVEAGLRGHDWSVPEQVNRVLLDTIADSLFASSADAVECLVAEGVGSGRVHLVGSTAADSVRMVAPHARQRAAWRVHGLQPGGYVVATVHHGFNLDDDERLARIVEALAGLARRVPVVFPMHARTARRLELMGDVYRLEATGVRCLPPLPYVDFVSLLHRAGAVVTDSGTVQEECSALGVRCYTPGSTTDRSVTATMGTNLLLGDDPRDIAEISLAAAAPTPSAIPPWDGHAGERIAASLVAGYALVRAV